MEQLDVPLAVTFTAAFCHTAHVCVPCH